jgi:hypothetical protein
MVWNRLHTRSALCKKYLLPVGRDGNKDAQKRKLWFLRSFFLRVSPYMFITFCIVLIYMLSTGAKRGILLGKQRWQEER